MIFVFAGILILFPPLGTILGIALTLVVIFYNVYLSTVTLQLIEGKLIKSTIFRSKEILISDIEKIERIKILGLFDKSPLAIRYVKFRTNSGTKKITTLGFNFDAVLSVLNQIEDYIQS